MRCRGAGLAPRLTRCVGLVVTQQLRLHAPCIRYIAHGGRLMEFEKQEEVFHADRLKSLIKSAQQSLESAQLLVKGEDVDGKPPGVYPPRRPAVTVQQLLDALEDGNTPNSPELWKPRSRKRK